MLEARNFPTVTWECVSEETLVNSFKKAGVSSESQVWSKFDDDYSFNLLDSQLKYFQDKRESPFVDFPLDGYADENGDAFTSKTHVITNARNIARVTQSQYDTTDVTRLGNVTTKKRWDSSSF